MTRNIRPLKEMIKEIDPDFYNNIDPNMKLFCSEVRQELKNEGHVVIGITGYPGVGKSNDVAIIGSLIDEDYDFEKNVCYIPTSKQIEAQYYGLKMYSFLHIDEASRGLHKHKWHDKIQQKLNELYDTEREGHFLATALIMPRFQNFTENFRNFMIKYWIHIPIKGIALFFKKDEDKDTKDPWHIDESYKKKKDKWGRKRVFERDLPSVIRAEQMTDCYWFYCRVPGVPKEVWSIYQDLKAKSRIVAREANIELESYKDKMNREKMEKWGQISKMFSQGLTATEQAVTLGISEATVRRMWREIRTSDKMNGTKYMVDSSGKDTEDVEHKEKFSKV